MSRTGHVASEAAKRFGANYATTDFETVLLDRDVDAVLIATRHILHTEMTLAALRAGKHVFVEKPLALSRGDLERIISYYSGSADNGGVPLLMTGFNRRFSPYLQRIRELVQTRSNPMILNYRMNAGYIPLDHWVHTREGGGRNLGEACHIYDLFTFLTGSRVLSVEAMAIKPRTAHYISTDNFVATLKFEDGSVATLTYTALGTHEYPKELFEVYSDGKVIILEDYRRLNVMGAKVKGIITRNQEKGHKEELESFEYALRKGGEWPIPLWQQVQATLISFLVEEKINGMKTGEAGQLMESST